MRVQDYDVKKKKLFENLGWAAFLLVVGSFLIYPDELPDGIWYVAIGIILILLNLSKFLTNIPISFLTSIGGSVLLIAGVVDYFGVDAPLGPIILIAIAIGIIIRSFSSYRK